MALLKPTPEKGIDESISHAIRSDAALDIANKILSGNEKTRSLAHSPEEINEIMEEAGIGVRDTIHQLANMQKFGSSESIRMRAMEKALEIHGLTGKRDQNSQPNVSINIVSEKAGLLNQVFNPQRG